MSKDTNDAASDTPDMFANLENCNSPFDALVVMMDAAPEGVKDYVNGRVQEILMIDLPKLHVLMTAGPACPASEAPEVAKLYAKSLDHMKECHPERYKDMSATIRDASLQLAELIDTSVKRILLDDVYANRHAAINLCAEHAKLTKCLIDIALTPDQLDEITAAEENSGDSD